MIPIGETKDGRGDYTNFEMDLIDTRMMVFKQKFGRNEKRKQGHSLCGSMYIKPSCVPITIVIVFVLLVVLLPLLNSDFSEDETPDWEKRGICNLNCSAFVTESIPDNLTYPAKSLKGKDTFEMWKQLIASSAQNLDLVAFYWTLLTDDTEKSTALMDDALGRKIYEMLKKAGSKTRMRILQNAPLRADNRTVRESFELANAGLATVKSLNFTKYFGSGVLHTKLWLVDNMHMYIGSANMDWRSLSQVKELGLSVFNCPCVVREAKKIFDIMWDLDNYSQLPRRWHFKYAAKFNATRPLKVFLNGVYSELYFAASPLSLSPKNRETDLSSIKHVILTAKKFVNIAVMDYAPEILYNGSRKFWPDLDDVILKAVLENDIHVRLLVSNWTHSFRNAVGILKHLLSFNCVAQRPRIHAKMFTVPAFDANQAKIPYARVNHNKFMVTDTTAYIGTSNWVGDYFTSTAGTSIVISQNASSNKPNIVAEMQSIFLRDWDSVYAKNVMYSHC